MPPATPKSPRCGECPVARWCKAQKLGLADDLPVARKKRETVTVTLAAAVLLDPRGQTLLTRESGNGGALFSRLWQFPAVEVMRDAADEITRYVLLKFNVTCETGVLRLAAGRHAVTYRNIRLAPFLFRVPRLPRVAGRTPTATRCTRWQQSRSCRSRGSEWSSSSNAVVSSREA